MRHPVTRAWTLIAATTSVIAASGAAAQGPGGSPFSGRPSLAGSPSFSFTDLRVQATKAENAPQVSTFANDQTIWVILNLSYSRRPTTPALFEYTVFGPSGKELTRGRATGNPRYATGTMRAQMNSFSIALPQGVDELRYVIRGSITLNGVTQTRTTTFRVTRGRPIGKLSPAMMEFLKQAGSRR